MNDHAQPHVAALRYLDLLKRCLTREIFRDQEVVDAYWSADDDLGDPAAVVERFRSRGMRIVQPARPPGFTPREQDWLPNAETMVGVARLDNVQELATRALGDGVPGDLVETGVWRGGTSILMRAVLEAFGDTARSVWVCDSFQGLPEPDVERYPADAPWASKSALDEAINSVLVVPLEQVQANFARYGLLDERVRFLAGWFEDTLPGAPIEQIALLRLDGDLYQSTMDALVALEPRVSPGGFVIVDDYNGIESCRQAVIDYRAERGIDDPIHEVDWTAVWWRKS